MASLADIGNAVREWYHANITGPESVPAFFQSRITRTPGVVQDLPSDVRGLYDPTMSPAREANASSQTSGMWAGLPAGMMRVTPGAGMGVGQNVISHESLHDIFSKAGIHGNEMTRLDSHIDPGIMEAIKSYQVYQNEARNQGPGAYSEEAAAAQLTNYGKKTKDLRDAITNLLQRSPQQKQQFQKLMEQGQ